MTPRVLQGTQMTVLSSNNNLERIHTLLARAFVRLVAGVVVRN